MVGRPAVVLSPFTRELLPVVQPWFHHPGVVEWLGGPDWEGFVRYLRRR